MKQYQSMINKINITTQTKYAVPTISKITSSFIIIVKEKCYTCNSYTLFYSFLSNVALSSDRRQANIAIIEMGKKILKLSSVPTIFLNPLLFHYTHYTAYTFVYRRHKSRSEQTILSSYITSTDKCNGGGGTVMRTFQ